MKAKTTRRPCLPAWAQRVAHEVHPAALPGRAQHLGYGRFQSLTSVRDDELDAAQAAPRELAQEVGPEGLRFGRADRKAQHLAPAVAVDTDRDDHGDRDDAPVAACLHIGGVKPNVGPLALQRPVQERLDLVVDLAAQPAHLALRDAGHAHRLDQFIDRAGRHTLHIGFLDHGGERLLGHPARLEEAREVAALPELGDPQLDRAGARLPVAVAVAVGDPLGAALAVGGPRSGLPPPVPSAAARQTQSSRATDR